jgi:hypothetical protein
VPRLQGDRRDSAVLWIHGADGEEDLISPRHHSHEPRRRLVVEDDPHRDDFGRAPRRPLQDTPKTVLLPVGGALLGLGFGLIACASVFSLL